MGVRFDKWSYLRRRLDCRWLREVIDDHSVSNTALPFVSAYGCITIYIGIMGKHKDEGRLTGNLGNGSK